MAAVVEECGRGQRKEAELWAAMTGGAPSSRGGRFSISLYTHDHMMKPRTRAQMTRMTRPQWILQADLLRLRAAVLQLWHACAPLAMACM